MCGSLALSYSSDWRRPRLPLGFGENVVPILSLLSLSLTLGVCNSEIPICFQEDGVHLRLHTRLKEFSRWFICGVWDQNLTHLVIDVAFYFTFLHLLSVGIFFWWVSQKGVVTGPGRMNCLTYIILSFHLKNRFVLSGKLVHMVKYIKKVYIEKSSSWSHTCLHPVPMAHIIRILLLLVPCTSFQRFYLYMQTKPNIYLSFSLFTKMMVY